MQSYKDVRPLVAAALLVVVAVACGDGRSSNAAGPSRTSEHPPAIVNGTNEIGDLTVAALFVPARANFTSSCTATLIGKQTALTVAHCVYNYHTSPPSLITSEICWFPCGNIYNCDPTTCVSINLPNTQVDPSFDTDQLALDFADHDLAVLRLGTDIPHLLVCAGCTTAAYSPRRIGGTPVAGAGIELVGYGSPVDMANTGIGQKRYGYNNIFSVATETFDYGKNGAYASFGDSGGPVFLGGGDCELGTTSRPDPNPPDPNAPLHYYTQNTRLTGTKVTWIKQAALDSSVLACGETVCGDGFCQDPETCSSCQQDCGPCCDSTTCPNGCCDANMVCHSPGNVDGACGSNAVICDICNPNDNGHCRSCPQGFICLQPTTRCPP